MFSWQDLNTMKHRNLILANEEKTSNRFDTCRVLTDTINSVFAVVDVITAQGMVCIIWNQRMRIQFH